MSLIIIDKTEKNSTSLFLVRERDKVRDWLTFLYQEDWSWSRSRSRISWDSGREGGWEHPWTSDWRGSFSFLSIFTLYSWKVCWTDIDPWYPGLTWKRVEFLKKSFLYIISFYFLKFHRKALWFIRQNDRYSSINIPFIHYKFFQK